MNIVANATIEELFTEHVIFNIILEFVSKEYANTFAF
jgi:hypothetical protein